MSTISRKELIDLVCEIYDRITIEITDSLADGPFEDSRDLNIVLTTIATHKSDRLLMIQNEKEEEG